jgi:hypothetical protein
LAAASSAAPSSTAGVYLTLCIVKLCTGAPDIVAGRGCVWKNCVKARRVIYCPPAFYAKVQAEVDRYETNFKKHPQHSLNVPTLLDSQLLVTQYDLLLQMQLHMQVLLKSRVLHHGYAL